MHHRASTSVTEGWTSRIQYHTWDTLCAPSWAVTEHHPNTTNGGIQAAALVGAVAQGNTLASLEKGLSCLVSPLEKPDVLLLQCCVQASPCQ